MSGGERLASLDGYSYVYPGGEKPSLERIDLSIGKGDFIILTGPSGCGKSTLAKAFCGFLEHGKKEGVVEFDGENSTNFSALEMAGRVGYVQQDPEAQIVTLSVEEEVAFGLENFQMDREEMQKGIRWALKAVKGERLLVRDTLTLSGGEKQKVAIASMLALKPELLILDEPTANLDPASTMEVLEAIESVHKETDMAIMVLEHHLGQFLPHANRIVVLKEGRKILDGPKEKMLAKRSVLENVGVRLPGERPYVKGKYVVRGGRPILSARKISCTRNGRRVLFNVSFDIMPGEIVALMGDNGSGKTTLLQSLLGLLPESRGQVYYKGGRVAGKKTSLLARRLGLVFQNPNHQLFETTVRDEVSFAPRNFGMDEKKADESTKRVLRRYGLEGMAERSPHNLSHGQKRRLNLASVESYGPNVLLLDEPFIGQDLMNTREICRHLVSIARRGGAVLLVVHDPGLVLGLSDRILFLDRGRLVVNASVEEGFKELEVMDKRAYLDGVDSDFPGRREVGP